MTKRKKININLIVSIVFVLICIALFLTKVPASHVNFTIYFDKSVNNSEVEIKYDKDIDMGLISENKVNFFVYSSHYNSDNITLKYPKGIKIDKIAISVRNNVSKEFTSSEIYSDAKKKINTDKSISLSMSKSFMDQYQNVCSKDFRLKLEIFSVVTAIYLLFMLRLVIRYIYSRYKLKGLAVFAVLIIYLVSSYLMFSKLRDSTKTKSLGIGASSVSDIITDDVEYKQTFRTEKNTKAINILFATYAQDVEGDYKFKVYDNNNKLVCEKTIHGSDIEDNSYYSISFENEELKANKKYYFTINADNYNNKDKLVFYTGEGNAYNSGILYDDGIETNQDTSFTLTINGPNRFLIVWISFTVFLTIAVLCCLFKERTLKSVCLILAIYIFGFIFAGFKMCFYLNNTSVDIYDELAQVSYIAYLEENDSIIMPNFADMKILIPYNQVEDMNNYDSGRLGQFSGIYKGKFSRLVNYLGHPPFYYHLMKMTNSVSIDGDMVSVNVSRLATANIILTLISILIIFYIGLTRIRKIPALHLLFVLIINSIHAVFFEAAAVNNDNLALLGVTLFIFGALRYSEKKYNLATYSLVALGLSIGILSKLTTGIIIAVAAVILVTWTCIKEKKVSSIFNSKFLMSMCIYIVPIVYYIYTLIHTGTIQPSINTFARDEYMKNTVLFVDEKLRNPVSFFRFCIKFVKNFMSQWSSGVPGINAKLSAFSLQRIGTIILWIFPIALFKKEKHPRDAGKRRLYLSLLMGTLVTLLLQFKRAFTDYEFISGHASYQSRYYLCLALFFGLVVLYTFEEAIKRNEDFVVIKTSKNTIKISQKKIIISVCLIYSIVLFFEGFISLLINNSDYIIYKCMW